MIYFILSCKNKYFQLCVEMLKSKLSKSSQNSTYMRYFRLELEYEI